MGTPRIDRLDQNVVINGGLHYWQRGTTFNAIPASTYFADRFRYNKVGAQVVNITRSTDVPALTGMVPASAIQVAVATANASPASTEYSAILQYIEHSFMNHLIGNNVTLLMSVKSPKVGKHYVTLVTGAGTQAIHLSYNIDTANVYQRVALNLQLPPGYSYLAGSGAGLILLFPLMTGSSLLSPSENTWVAAGTHAGPGMQNLLDSTSNVFKVTGIELVQGTHTVEKAFAMAGRNPLGEFQLCQRYCYSLFEIGAGSILQPGYSGMATGTTGAEIYARFPVKLRANGVLTLIGTAGNFMLESSNGSTIAATGITMDGVGPDSARLNVTVASGLVAGNATVLSRNASSGLTTTNILIDADY